MPGLTAQGSLPLQLEAFAPQIADTIESEGLLARYLDNGPGSATRVSLRSFRARLKVAKASAPSQINLDTGSMPLGVGNKWDQMLLSPVSWALPVQYSQLAQHMEGDKVATDSAVAQTIADVVDVCIHSRDIFLQTPGDGSLGSVDSTTGANFINLRSSTTTVLDGRAAHLLQEQQPVQIMSPTYVLRGSCVIQQVFKGLGQLQQVQVDAIPPGTVAGDLVIVAGASPGAPQFINGIPVFVSTSALGNLYGISRALPYVVANGINLNNAAQVTKPVFRIAQNQIIQRLGSKALKNQFWHMHPAQLQAIEELAFGDSYVPLEGGKGGSYDPLFAEFTLNGRKIVWNQHSDMTRLDLLLKETWNTIKWGPGMFWFKNRAGQMVFQLVDPTTGSITMQELMFYVIAKKNMLGDLKPSLIDSEAEMANEAQAGVASVQGERLSAMASDGTMQQSELTGKENRKTLAEMPSGNRKVANSYWSSSTSVIPSFKVELQAPRYLSETEVSSCDGALLAEPLML